MHKTITIANYTPFAGMCSAEGKIQGGGVGFMRAGFLSQFTNFPLA